MSLGHHEEEFALKSPVITDKDGLRLFMLLKSFSVSQISQIHYYFGWGSNTSRYNCLFIVVSHL